jgi:SET domain-containing protein
MALSQNVIVSTRKDSQKGLFAGAHVARGEVLLTYDGPRLDHPTRLSIQIDDHVHVEGTDDSNAFLNHSCEPNAFVDWVSLCLRARRDIASGEEITCNYNTTDYEIHSVFTCTCGSPHCKGLIKGFKYLSGDEQRALEPWLPSFLKRKIV